ncbi:biopolymer transport protein ExbD/TolR [Arcicella aurantiaca]|uniref:Biopolymer transport protein ExbD/TolR n=1 Tax=Arcicella aurantiaca TaxID=591202 RepID=A0A316EDG9_9BACT|nr:biopolymer transporter ExbD [Arcicella aurantiaca]PWK27420.1 biopolymer transport protein ExbD/TolR [Arcicella aurantiaca]
MPKVKAKRQSVSLDMTAMCDVAFLLLTFFMLTAKFKPEEAVTITPPSSISEKALPANAGFLTVSVGPEGGIFLGTDDKLAKDAMLERMANRMGIAITPEMQKNYNASELVGYPAGAMRQVLGMKPSDVKAQGLMKGIPCDSANNELFLWVSYAKIANPALQVAIKGDANSNYKVFNQIVGTLQEQNINKFQLVTSPEGKPQ